MAKFNIKILFALLFFIFTGCAANKKMSGIQRFNLAMDYYNKKKYSDAIDNFNKASALLKGKKEEIEIAYYKAYSLFYKDELVPSADCFKNFHETFSSDNRAEEAHYMQGYALFKKSPYSNLDQEFTLEALEALKEYLLIYPNGKYSQKAFEHVIILQQKLEDKYFNIAMVYYNMKNFNAAIVAFDNFINEFSESKLIELANYYKIKAHYCILKSYISVISKNIDILQDVNMCKVRLIKLADNFMNNYPNSIKRVKVENMLNYLLSLSNVN
jgi:outer membrane protein assembly factor BamD